MRLEGVLRLPNSFDHWLTRWRKTAFRAQRLRAGRGLSGSHKLGKRSGQSVQSAANDPNVVQIVQVCVQGDLGWLVQHVAPQVRAAQPPQQLARGLGERVLGWVVRALHDQHDVALAVPRQGMPE